MGNLYNYVDIHPAIAYNLRCIALQKMDGRQARPRPEVHLRDRTGIPDATETAGRI